MYGLQATLILEPASLWFLSLVAYRLNYMYTQNIKRTSRIRLLQCNKKVSRSLNMYFCSIWVFYNLSTFTGKTRIIKFPQSPFIYCTYIAINYFQLPTLKQILTSIICVFHRLNALSWHPFNQSAPMTNRKVIMSWSHNTTQTVHVWRTLVIFVKNII